MAKMYPAECSPATESKAEKSFFEYLKRDPATKDWTVLHSVGISDQKASEDGEVDFVVLIPGKGIVCIEVKGGGISCRDGVWYTKNEKGEKRLKESPFPQSRRNCYKLIKDKLHKKFPEGNIKNLPYGYMVAFPGTVCPEPTAEFIREDVIDSDDIRRPVSIAILRFCNKKLETRKDRDNNILPSPTEIDEVRKFLRPDFDLMPTKSSSIWLTEQKLTSLTEEQYERLDEWEQNDRCLVTGAAGTGKTFLAITYAARAAESGKKCLLLCFNRVFGSWLESRAGDFGLPNLETGSYYQWLRKKICESAFSGEFLGAEEQARKEGNTNNLFEEIYPLYGELLFESIGAQYDVLILDEAQDLFREGILDVLNRTVAGGIAGGRWAFFGDFYRQSLYGSVQNPAEVLKRYCPHFANNQLVINCRNTKRIGTSTARLSGFAKSPFKIDAVDGLPVEYYFYSNQPAFLKKIEKCVGELLRNGLVSEEIVVLSPKKLSNSCLAGVRELCGIPVVEIGDIQINGKRKNQIVFSTIHSFKGMESSSCILVDIEEVNGEYAESMLYTGMSRARAFLAIFVPESIQSAVDKKREAGILKELEAPR